jgi:hypothetical protein
LFPSFAASPGHVTAGDGMGAAFAKMGNYRGILWGNLKGKLFNQLSQQWTSIMHGLKYRCSSLLQVKLVYD